MRAAFKAVQDSKQVAVSDADHGAVASSTSRASRSASRSFPVNIEMISRFRTAKEQKEILEKDGGGQSRYSDRHAPHFFERS